MSTAGINLVLERQLLLELGDRLQRLRQSKGLTAVEMAEQCGIARNTLRAVETGDPGPSIGTYLRAMSVLGISGELALLAGDALEPAPRTSAAARSKRAAPVVQVRVSVDEGKHRLQDLQSLALHEEAVRLAKADPALVARAQDTVQRWLLAGDPRSASLWREWSEILDAGSWRKVMGRTGHAQQLRQASPLVTILRGEARQRILRQVGELKRGIEMGGPVEVPTARTRAG
ncbi:helix-turn-helix domain-containing protein [Variovorax saccharolyticus]|uniref:helix-turn-helix domain-containing protein n=1 Tax=Variovorax saccharolyticus TaxID=3053516 RepID=UPI00257871FA|nr:helix-turn-helix transcriptional regulator [Variovorax sp. J31P216]MDM0029854.1 helix-turn-helix transcriptional regulator [Variovorax sp. J31P216]